VVISTPLVIILLCPSGLQISHSSLCRLLRSKAQQYYTSRLEYILFKLTNNIKKRRRYIFEQSSLHRLGKVGIRFSYTNAIINALIPTHIVAHSLLCTLLASISINYDCKNISCFICSLLVAATLAIRMNANCLTSNCGLLIVVQLRTANFSLQINQLYIAFRIS
jgi:hypothetical protein